MIHALPDGFSIVQDFLRLRISGYCGLTGSLIQVIIGGEDGELVTETDISGAALNANELIAFGPAGDIIEAGNGNNVVFGDNGYMDAAAQTGCSSQARTRYWLLLSSISATTISS